MPLSLADSDIDEEVRSTAWQEVHLESDDEGPQPPRAEKEGHLLAATSDQYRQPSAEPKESIRFLPAASLLPEEQRVSYHPAYLCCALAISQM